MSNITERQRDALIEHLDGRRVSIIAPTHFRGLDAVKAAQKYQTTKALIDKGYLKVKTNTSRPSYTTITEEGRRRLSALLADYADALAAVDEDFLAPGNGSSGSHQRIPVNGQGSLTPGNTTLMETNLPGPTEQTTASYRSPEKA